MSGDWRDSALPSFEGDEPLTDEEVMRLGYRPTEKGWVRLRSSEKDGNQADRPKAGES